ncbi:MAG: sorbosone dehydrogenase family protein [Oligoflexales bacterium]
MKLSLVFIMMALTNAAFGAGVALKKIASGFDKPLAIVFVPGEDNHYVVVQQRGKVFSVKNGQRDATPFLDFSGKVSQLGNETGLLGLAFHPDFAQNKKLYINYTSGIRLKTTISELVVGTDGKVKANSERELLGFGQPYPNHNGGDLKFGPDGYLYIATGDGGLYGDPHNNAQNKNAYLGKILRIDVNSGSPYGIPNDNPFANLDGTKREIFAYGLRNPWRFNFDTATGLLWAGDVGQDKVEEIDIVRNGGNYGWKIMEGSTCYGTPNCDNTGFEEPVFDYPHSEGISITGGYVYRGSKISALEGKYVYADFGFGTIWALDPETSPVANEVIIGNSGINPSSFGQGPDGELYVLDHTGGDVYQFIAQ